MDQSFSLYINQRCELYIFRTPLFPIKSSATNTRKFKGKTVQIQRMQKHKSNKVLGLLDPTLVYLHCFHLWYILFCLFIYIINGLTYIIIFLVYVNDVIVVEKAALSIYGFTQGLRKEYYFHKNLESSLSLINSSFKVSKHTIDN